MRAYFVIQDVIFFHSTSWFKMIAVVLLIILLFAGFLLLSFFTLTHHEDPENMYKTKGKGTFNQNGYSGLPPRSVVRTYSQDKKLSNETSESNVI